MGRNILLIDDNVHFRDLVVPVLRRRGHFVRQAASGAEADALLAQFATDLIIVDYLLPDTEGERWVERLRARGAGTPVVFVTSFRQDLQETNRLITELDVALVLHKPILPSAFGEQIQNLFAEPHSFALEGPSETSITQAQVRDDYTRVLPIELGRLAQAVHHAKAHPEVVEALSQAQTIAHRLRGILLSLGFSEIGALVARIDDGLEVTALAPPLERSFVEIDLALSQLGRTVERTTPKGETDFGAVEPAARILVVEGGEHLLQSLIELGRRQLMEVVGARNSAEALDEARHRKPDVAIIDVALDPPSDGFQLARQLRELPGLASIPIAFLSSDAALNSRVAAAHAGASLFLTTPIDDGVFAAAIHELLAARRVDRAHVVVAEGDRAYAQYVAQTLESSGMRVTLAHEPPQLAEVLADARPDLLIVGATISGLSGFDVCRMVRIAPGWQDIPILFLTTESRMKSRVAAFEAGADDYLAKPVLAEELLARARVRIERARLLRERADKDVLTGLWLRRAFLDMVRGRIAEVARHDRPLTIALLDLDHLKQTNDTHGHLAGDHVLTTLGRLLQSRFRTEDLRGRWGGDEFVLAFPGEKAETIDGALTRTLHEFAMMRFRSEGEEIFSSTFSAGLASFPWDGETLEALLRRADKRLYVAKATRGLVIAAD